MNKGNRIVTSKDATFLRYFGWNLKRSRFWARLYLQPSLLLFPTLRLEAVC